MGLNFSAKSKGVIFILSQIATGNPDLNPPHFRNKSRTQDTVFFVFLWGLFSDARASNHVAMDDTGLAR